MSHDTMDSDYKSQLCSEYFESIASGAALYILVVLNSAGVPRMYVETPHNKRIDKSQVRVFFRKEDYTYYAKYVINKDRLDTLMIKRLELTPTEAATVVIDLDKMFVKMGYAGVEAIASVIEDNEIHDLDVFWSKKDETELL